MKVFIAFEILVVLGAAMPLLISGRESARSNPPSPMPVDGGQIFRNFCAACHGARGKGDGPAAAALKHRPADLTLIAQHNGGKFPRDRVKAMIAGQEEGLSAHGSREMPVWGPVFHEVEWDQDLGEVRLDNVTRFVERLQQK